jgi:hypothetical protein
MSNPEGLQIVAGGDRREPPVHEITTCAPEGRERIPADLFSANDKRREAHHERKALAYAKDKVLRLAKKFQTNSE